MKLVVAPEAAAQILLRKQWWRANRSKAPERFDEGETGASPAPPHDDKNPGGRAGGSPGALRV